MLVVVLADEFEAVFDDGHHAEAEQIDFDDAEVGAVFLVPLHDDAAGHGGGLEGNDAVELALADDHAAGVLAEVARHVLHGHAELEIFGACAGAGRRSRHGGRSGPWCRFRRATPRGRRAAERRPRDSGSKPRALPTSRAADAAVGDDVGGHGGAEFAVTLVDVLDDLFAFVVGGQVEIDVGPLAAVFAEEALEEQFHADGIDWR